VQICAQRLNKCIDKGKKPATALLNYDQKQRSWVYEVVDPESERAFYVGRTLDLWCRT